MSEKISNHDEAMIISGELHPAVEEGLYNQAGDVITIWIRESSDAFDKVMINSGGEA